MQSIELFRLNFDGIGSIQIIQKSSSVVEDEEEEEEDDGFVAFFRFAGGSFLGDVFVGRPRPRPRPRVASACSFRTRFILR